MHRGDRDGAGARARGQRLARAALPDPHPQAVFVPDVYELDVRARRERGVVLDARADLPQVHRLHLLVRVQKGDGVRVAHRDAVEGVAREQDLRVEGRRAHVHP